MTTKITNANITNTGVSAGSYTNTNLTVNAQGQITAASNGTGGGGTPGGSDTQVQFNDAGSFGGDAGLTYNKTTNTLSTDVVVFSAGSASAPSITTTGDTNTGVYFPAADTAAITTGGTERMRIDSSGKVGIGVTPSAWTVTSVLQLSNGNVRSSGNTVAIGANWFFDGASKYIANDFASDNYHQDGDIIWRNAPSGTAGNSITWSERMRINANGTIKTGSTISVGGATPSTSGAGITFPATQSASSDANTLDDYEEGTWTPTCSNGSTYSGTYTKIGRIVHLFFETSSSGTITANSTTLSGLPFTPSGSANSSGSGTYVNVTSTAAFGGLQITASSLYFVTSTSSAALRGYHCYYV